MSEVGGVHGRWEHLAACCQSRGRWVRFLARPKVGPGASPWERGCAGS